MSKRLCTACGHENSDSVVYCAHCGELLKPAPVPIAGQPLPTSVAVARRRVESAPASSVMERSLWSRLIGVFVYCVYVALGVAAVLALMSPKSENASVAEARRVQNPAALIQQQILSARSTPSTISQALVNDFLKSSGSIELKAPSFLPSSAWPKWERSEVEFGPSVVTASIQVSFLGFPIHFSETFKLVGSARLWKVEPASASIGLLPLSKPFLPLVTPLVTSCSLPLAREITALEAADLLQIRSGFLDFTLR